MEVVAGNPPTIAPLATVSRYQPGQAVTIQAVVSGAVGTCVQWNCAAEDGWDYMDLSRVSRSSQVQCFTRDIPSREFPLVVPASGPGFPGLRGGARYKFLVTASHPLLGGTEASVEVSVLSPPSPGTLTLSPQSGTAVQTVFTLTAADWQDEDVPLTFTFGYRQADGREISWLGNAAVSGLPRLEAVLPASRAGLVGVVRVCDSTGSCSTAEADTVTEVQQQPLTTAQIMALGARVAELATDQECGAALSLLGRVLDTVAAQPDQARQYQAPLCSLHSDLLAQCCTDLSARLDCTELGAGRELLAHLVTTQCSPRLDTVERGTELAAALANQTRVCALQSSQLAGAALTTTRLGYSFSPPTAAVALSNSRQPSKLGFTRRRRSTEALLGNLLRTLSPQDIERYLGVGLRAVQAYSAGDDGEKFRQLAADLLASIHDSYMAEMCRGATSQSPPETVRTEEITVTMVRTEMNNGAEEKFVFDQTERSIFGASSVQLMDSVYEQYSQWDCGKRDRTGEQLPCVGLCLGTAVLDQDLVSPTSDRYGLSYIPISHTNHLIKLQWI